MPKAEEAYTVEEDPDMAALGLPSSFGGKVVRVIQALTPMSCTLGCYQFVLWDPAHK